MVAYIYKNKTNLFIVLKKIPFFHTMTKLGSNTTAFVFLLEIS